MSDVTEFKRDHYYQALREYGLPHHLAETIVDEFGHACGAMVVGAQINEQLRAENARLKAEIDAGNRAYQQLWASYEEATRIAAVHATELAAIKARRCETCRHWNRVADSDFGVCGFWTDDRSTWHAYDDERCRNWRDKEAADAD